MGGRLKRLIEGKNRGKNIIKVFKKYFNNLKDKKVLDIGCGYGAIAMEFAKYFKEVHAIDIGKKEISIARKRAKDKNIKNIKFFVDNALDIKTTQDKFDVIHLSGVFEWLRAGNPNLTAEEAQELFLKKIKKFMKEDAILYSGTENKLFPFFWIKDPHTGYPLLVLLPNKIADFLFKLIGKGKYIPKIHSYWKLKRMFKKEFEQVDFYIPIPHYQYVYEFAYIENRKEIIEKVNKVLRNYKLDKIQKITVWWIKIIAHLGLTKLLTPGFITVASKNKKSNKK